MVNSQPRPLSKFKFAAFTLLPVGLLMLVILAAEFYVRVSYLDRPELRSPFVTPGFELIHRDDEDLFFSLRPDLAETWQGVTVSTNSLGLRSPEITPKQPDEFRVLSLGESTTFGAGVKNNQTYSALLEEFLRLADSSHTYRVINAGVSAYSSFQSLKYLELRGFELEPNLVLFYHEINDFLPSSIREIESSHETGLALTDRQLYESKRLAIQRGLLQYSALYRMLSFQRSRTQLANEANLPAKTQVEHTPIPKSFSAVASIDGIRAVNLPPRVTLEERKENLRHLQKMCDDHGVKLVIIHPSYAESIRHECELTVFCKNSGVPVFEAYGSLHPDGPTGEHRFLDIWHPSPSGHRALAKNLARFLVESRLAPAPSVQ